MKMTKLHETTQIRWPRRHGQLVAAAALLLAAPWAAAQDANLARNLAATCANCHGTKANARGDMKPLAGL